MQLSANFVSLAVFHDNNYINNIFVEKKRNDMKIFLIFKITFSEPLWITSPHSTHLFKTEKNDSRNFELLTHFIVTYSFPCKIIQN